MKNFIQAYIFTLVPTTMLSIISFSLYYYFNQFSFSKSMSIGTLQGFVIALVLNILPALVLWYKTNHNTQPKIKENNQKNNIDLQYSLYILLDYEKAFELVINAIGKQSVGKILNSDKHKGILFVKTKYQTIKFKINKLTRHTAEIRLQTQQDTNILQDILFYIKDKEKAYLQY